MDFIRKLLTEADSNNDVDVLQRQLADLASQYNHIDNQSARDKDEYNSATRTLKDKIAKLSGTKTPDAKKDPKTDTANAVAHWEKQLDAATKRAAELEKTAPPKGEKISPRDVEQGKKRHKYLHALGEVNIAKRELKDAKSKLASKK